MGKESFFAGEYARQAAIISGLTEQHIFISPPQAGVGQHSVLFRFLLLSSPLHGVYFIPIRQCLIHFLPVEPTGVGGTDLATRGVPKRVVLREGELLADRQDGPVGGRPGQPAHALDVGDGLLQAQPLGVRLVLDGEGRHQCLRRRVVGVANTVPETECQNLQGHPFGPCSVLWFQKRTTIQLSSLVWRGFSVRR